jgi:hypothetical protein
MLLGIFSFSEILALRLQVDGHASAILFFHPFFGVWCEATVCLPLRKTRTSLWEIYPIMKIEVKSAGKWRTLP